MYAKAPDFVATGPDATPVLDNDEAILNYAYAKSLSAITGR